MCKLQPIQGTSFVLTHYKILRPEFGPKCSECAVKQATTGIALRDKSGASGASSLIKSLEVCKEKRCRTSARKKLRMLVKCDDIRAGI
ncbi:MAG: hypothetical protein AAB965_02515 [Patescibacteria group bacterium]